MPLNFPNSPILNDTYSFGTRTWKYNGEAWELVTRDLPVGPQGAQGLQGPQGPQGPTGSPTQNRIINGDFSVAQRGSSYTSTNSANNDDTYVIDRWYILSDGNDAIDITQETSIVPTNQKYAIALDVETINKKFGIAQIIENKNCVGLIGQDVVLSFKAKVSSTTKLDNVKAAIVSWSGTADVVTSDIVSTWNVENTNPTLITNSTYENTPSNLNLTTTYATYSLTANIDTANATNIIVFIWSDVTDTTLGDFLYITDVQLEPGTTATPFERENYHKVLQSCQRYYQRCGGQPTGLTETAGSSGVIGIGEKFYQEMRIAPTLGVFPGESVSFRYNGSDLTSSTNIALSNQTTQTSGYWVQVSATWNISITGGLLVYGRQFSNTQFIYASSEL